MNSNRTKWKNTQVYQDWAAVLTGRTGGAEAFLVVFATVVLVYYGWLIAHIFLVLGGLVIGSNLTTSITAFQIVMFLLITFIINYSKLFPNQGG